MVRPERELEFLGNTLFIPMFFISIGFLIDVKLFVQRKRLRAPHKSFVSPEKSSSESWEER